MTFPPASFPMKDAHTAQSIMDLIGIGTLESASIAPFT